MWFCPALFYLWEAENSEVNEKTNFWTLKIFKTLAVAHQHLKIAESATQAQCMSKNVFTLSDGRPASVRVCLPLFSSTGSYHSPNSCVRRGISSSVGPQTPVWLLETPLLHCNESCLLWHILSRITNCLTACRSIGSEISTPFPELFDIKQETWAFAYKSGPTSHNESHHLHITYDYVCYVYMLCMCVCVSVCSTNSKRTVNLCWFVIKWLWSSRITSVQYEY
jgi:hypothetical protein